MADNPTDKNALIAQFSGITGAAPQEAEQFLISSDWDLDDAAATYYASQEDAAPAEAEGGAPAPAEYTGPRTLDGRPAPESRTPTVASSSRPPRRAPRSGIATLGSIANDPAQHGHDDDDSDDPDFHDDEQPRDLFAGGEKSGLAVQDPRRNDPRNLVDEIIKKAKSQASRAESDPTPAPPSRFHGSGITLGDSSTPSTVLPSATPAAPPAAPQRRILHLWNDGFSIEDGPLHRFDDPQNAADLAVIESGRAPIHLMNVAYDQPVDVQLNRHEEDYKKPKTVYKPFSGGGQRLGSPVPGAGSSSASAPIQSSAGPSSAQTTSQTPQVEVDPALPTLSLRIQLANGTRLPARFNTTHSIGDVYDFIARASPDSSTRAWVVATTFPSKDHTDKSAVLGELEEFKRGGVAVQKWV
ncbi:hypothetical protein V498_00872 [Pseudogymnoascus sp. VKM F-4517 (FW-2822)]|nr:hypothetical protein V498_00872 [Pseudogymnoascus sp. VKM F-4517 (FW-2822)]